VLEVTNWDGDDAVDELVVVSNDLFVVVDSQRVYSSCWDKNANLFFVVGGRGELRKEFAHKTCLWCCTLYPNCLCRHPIFLLTSVGQMGLIYLEGG